MAEPKQRGGGDPEIRKLSEIVFDMISENVPDSVMSSTLQQYGMTKQQAEDVINKVKDEYGKFTGAKLQEVVRKVLEEKFSRRMTELKKEIELREEIKDMEHRKYVDSKAEQIEKEVGILKSHDTELEFDVENRLDKMESKLEMLKTVDPKQKMLATGLLLIALFSVIVLLF
ncbi:MAG: hypothetical protein V1911_02855, partial [Candidatus Micrarchaeota archaeon]